MRTRRHPVAGVQTFVKTSLLISAAFVALHVHAQTFTVLHRFLQDGVDGAVVSASPTVHNGMLYGITRSGGLNNGGTLYKVETNGANYQILHHFAGDGAPFTDANGKHPFGSPVVEDNAVYGVTQDGGGGNGSVFKVGTDGSSYQVLHAFLNNADGFYPGSGLLLRDGWLFGTCLYAGSDGGYAQAGGTLYAVDTEGQGFHVRTTFSRLGVNPVTVPAYDLAYIPTNNQGVYSFVGVSLDSGGFGPLQPISQYNPTGMGGGNYGAIFGFTAAVTAHHHYSFTGGEDGAYPAGGVIIEDTNTEFYVYGVTAGDWAHTAGTVYRYEARTDTLTNLHTFTTALSSQGMLPVGKLVRIGDTLYGVTRFGGSANSGVIYKVNTDGTGFEVLHSFDPFYDGGGPLSGLTADGYILYGTTTAFGSADSNVAGSGTLFKLDVTPPKPPLLNLGSVSVGVEHVLALTNGSGTAIAVHYVTNHVYLPAKAIHWNAMNGMTYTLLKAHDLKAPLNSWMPVPPNWTNRLDQRHVGFIIEPDPMHASTFFRLQAVAQ